MAKGKKTSKEAWAYFAGYVDGEGCVYVDSNTHLLRLQIMTCYPGVLHWICDQFGGSAPSLAKRKRPEGHRGAYRWGMSGAALKPILTGILPYSQEKKAQLELGLEFLSTEDKIKKAEIAMQIKALKKVVFYEKNIIS